MASVGVLVHYMKKPATPQASKLPDPEVLLLGVCAQLTVWYVIVISLPADTTYDLFCDNNGLGVGYNS